MDIKPKQTMGQNKLLLLFLLDKSNMELSDLQIVTIMSELGLMRYFDLKECLFELEQSGHIYASEALQAKVYSITQKGRDMLHVLEDDLRASFRDAVEEYVAKNKTKLAMQSQFVGEYKKQADDEYLVTLRVIETNKIVFEIGLLIHSREEAKKIVENWGPNAVPIYKDILLRLG